MEIIIKAEPKEIAALVLAVQERQADIQPTQKELVCVANHLGCFLLSGYRGITVDATLPCEICDYLKECYEENKTGLQWSYNTNWIFDKAGVHLSPKMLKEAIAKRVPADSVK